MSIGSRKLLSIGGLYADMTPSKVPRDWEGKRKTGWQGSISWVRMQTFKRKLNAQLSKYPSSPKGILESKCDWFGLLPEALASRFAMMLQTEKEIDIAYTRILAKCMRKRAVEFDDLRRILLQISPEPEIKQEEEKKEENVSDEEKKALKAKETWEEKLNEIKKTTTVEEDKILPCLVDPGTYHGRTYCVHVLCVCIVLFC